MHEKAVVVGAGGISNSWFPPLIQEKVEVLAVVDLRLAAAQAQIDKYKLNSEASDDLRGTLRRTDPDFVIDLTVPEAHSAVTCSALRAGFPVVSEKPMAASMVEARRMVRTAEQTGKLYMVSQSRRWEPKHERIRATVAAGEIGPVTMVNCDFFLGAHFGGFRDEMASPLVLDMAIHHFDLARYMTGADPVAVYAHQFNPRGSWYRGAAAANCVFEMSNGVVFNYRGSWCAEGCDTSWNGNWRIVGEKGTLVYENDKEPSGQVVDGGSGFRRPLREANVPESRMEASYMHGALREMLKYLRAGARPQTECHDNIKSLAMVFAAIESAARGKRISVRIM